MPYEVVFPTDKLPPWQPARIGLLESDRRLISSTFRRLCDLVEKLPPDRAADCLLLLTTCRNAWYTINAMFTEAKKWSEEGRNTQGFGDAIDTLSKALTGTGNIEEAAKRAAGRLEVCADYLQEFEKKQRLFMDRFEEVRTALLQYAQSITDVPARAEFLATFANLGSGPGPSEDELNGPEDVENDIYLERLREWFAMTRPLTSLARTYISDVLGIGRHIPKGSQLSEYCQQIAAAALVWESRGIRTPQVPPAEVFNVVKGLDYSSRERQLKNLRDYLVFCEQMVRRAREFLVEMLPSTSNESNRGFPLQRLTRSQTVTLGNSQFELRPDMFVLITDMRNSTGAPFLTPELKAKVEEVISRLREQNDASSQTHFDDSRVIACTSLGDMAMCVLRLYNALLPYQSPDGFGGIRIGCTRGEMLFAFDGRRDWKDVRRSAPLDSADNTIACAARLMGLDKLRWDKSSDGEKLRQALGDWNANQSLLFLDSRVHETLPQVLREKCRDTSVLDLKGIGKRQCWAIPIPEFIVRDNEASPHAKA